jgi:predicted NUDIX family NTP pyrophosphohydrolase
LSNVSLVVLRVHDLSGFVARQLSGRHSVPKGVRDEPDEAATGDTEDEIRRSV